MFFFSTLLSGRKLHPIIQTNQHWQIYQVSSLTIIGITKIVAVTNPANENKQL
jgi:hypothetical protein